MTEPLCVLACGVRQVTSDTRKMDQSAETIPAQGKTPFFFFFRLNSMFPDCFILTGAGVFLLPVRCGQSGGWSQC